MMHCLCGLPRPTEPAEQGLGAGWPGDSHSLGCSEQDRLLLQATGPGWHLALKGVASRLEQARLLLPDPRGMMTMVEASGEGQGGRGPG